MPRQKTAAERNAEIVRYGSYLVPESMDEAIREFVTPSYRTYDGYRTIDIENVVLSWGNARADASAYVHSFEFRYDET